MIDVTGNNLYIKKYFDCGIDKVFNGLTCGQSNNLLFLIINSNIIKYFSEFQFFLKTAMIGLNMVTKEMMVFIMCIPMVLINFKFTVK